MRPIRFALAIVLSVMASVPSARAEGDAWVPSGSLAFGRALHVAALLPDGDVLVVGGRGCPGALSASAPLTEVFDVATGSWSIGDSMPISTDRLAMTTLSDGRLLVSGGQATYGACASRVHLPMQVSQIYDPVAHRWEVGPRMVNQRVNHALVTLLDGRVLAVGGEAAARERAEIFDPVGNAWASTDPMTFDHASATATMLKDGRVLVAGGNSFGGSEIFDPASGEWSAIPKMIRGRSGHTATLLSDGRVLVVGGANALERIDDAEIYDPDADRWESAGSLNAERYGHTATELADGRILVAGGYDGIRDLKSTEVFDPVSGEWSVGPSMASLRGAHTATRLRDGSVLVVAGYVGTEQFTATAERFIPAT